MLAMGGSDSGGAGVEELCDTPVNILVRRFNDWVLDSDCAGGGAGVVVMTTGVRKEDDDDAAAGTRPLPDGVRAESLSGAGKSTTATDETGLALNGAGSTGGGPPMDKN
jgi:hypothetical protein